jgi:hypothetical protein
MATFLRQSDCAGEHHANPNRLRDPDAISRSIKSNKNKIFIKTQIRLGLAFTKIVFKMLVVFCGALGGPFCSL